MSRQHQLDPRDPPRLRRGQGLAVLLALAACASPAGVEHLAAPNAVGPYSAAVTAGDLVFLAGKIGRTDGTFTDEVSAAIDNVENDLKRLGLDLSHAVSVTVYLTDMARFTELNEVYARRFPAPWPARTTVAVAALPKAAHVEIQVVARRP